VEFGLKRAIYERFGKVRTSGASDTDLVS